MISLVLTLVLAPALATGQDARAPDTAPVARDTLDLAALQRAAVEGDPRLRRVALQEAATELRLRTLSAERLPTLAVTGEAIHQSEVAGIPIALPNAESPAPPADRWEAALNTDWLLYDGGSIAARRDLEHAELATARAELTAELHPLRMEVAEAYFGALVLQEQLREMAALVEDLEARFTQVREHVAAGAALPADTAAVLAELLRARQQVDEVAAHRRASLAVLRELTAVPVTETDVLTVPDLSDPVARARATTPRDPPAHPQYAVFAARREVLEREGATIRTRLMPRVSAFGEYAYGRPGFEQFTRDPHTYWLAGVRVRWVLWDWGAVARTAEAVGLQQRILVADEQAFSERLTRQVQAPLQAMDRLEAALETDRRIIALREQVERQASARFDERDITAAAYVDARTDLQEARIALVRHRAELARAQAEYLTILGMELR